jgi:hypothetical protein
MDARSLRNVLPVLKVLQGLSHEDRLNLLPHLASNVHDGIQECILNATCNSTIPLELKKIIKKHTMKDAEAYKYILKPNTTPRKINKKLQEVGGNGLGVILQAVVPVLERITQKGNGVSKNKKIKIEKEESEEETSDEDEESSEEETDSSEEEEEEETSDEEEEEISEQETSEEESEEN